VPQASWTTCPRAACTRRTWELLASSAMAPCTMSSLYSTCGVRPRRASAARSLLSVFACPHMLPSMNARVCMQVRERTRLLRWAHFLV